MQMNKEIGENGNELAVDAKFTIGQKVTYWGTIYILIKVLQK